MEPCRSSTNKSKRRQSENVEEEIDDDSDNNNVLADAAKPLLGEDPNLADSNNDEQLFHSGSSFEAAIKAADASSSSENRISSTFSDTTTLLNNCSVSNTQNGGTTKRSKWRYSFSSSGRRPIIDAMDILGKETVKGLKGAKQLHSSSSLTRGVLDGGKNKEMSPPMTISPKPITSIIVLENGLLVTASRSEKHIKLWKVNVPPPEENAKSREEHDVDNNVEFICEFKGHVSGVTTMVKLDKRGRFLTASLDKTVKLWEIDCSKDDDDVIKDGPNLLATFTDLDKRWIKVRAVKKFPLFLLTWRLTNTHLRTPSVYCNS